MENLTKQQIVLVTLLVSFVTSIATGIVTVALMNQAPPSFTQTINRVVEHTVERVVQTPAQPAAAVVTKETVVVKADDMVVAAIDQNTKSVVRFVPPAADGSLTQPKPTALGLVLTKDGLIVVDSNRIDLNFQYVGAFSDGTSFPLTLVSSDQKKGLSIFKVKLTADQNVSFIPAILADSNGLKLGQTVVFIGGVQNDTVETGLISSLGRDLPIATDATSTPAAASNVNQIYTNIHPGENTGGILADLSAEVAAFEVLRDSGAIYLPSNALTDVLQSYIASQTASTTPLNQSTTP